MFRRSWNCLKQYLFLFVDNFFFWLFSYRRQNDEVNVSTNGSSLATNKAAEAVQTFSYKKLEESGTKDVFFSEAPPTYNEVTQNQNDRDTIPLTGGSGADRSEMTSASREADHNSSAPLGDEVAKVDLGSQPS